MTKRSIRGKRKVFSRHPENGKRPNGNGKEAAQKMFLEHAFIPIFTVRKDGVFLDMNKIAAKTLGGNPKDFIGSTMWELFPEKYAKLQLKSIRAAIRKRNVLITERQTVIGGKKRWYNTFIYPVKDENGKADSAVIMAEDITDKVEKDKEIDLKAKFLDSATDAIIMHDFSGRIIYFNEVAHKSLGYTGDEFKKLRLREIDAPWSADLIKSRTAELKRKKALKFEVEHKRKDGVLIPMEVLAKVIRVEGEDRVLSICRDISDRKKMENELRQREEQYAAVIRNIGVGVSLISKDMKVLSLNPLMRKWFPKVDPAKRPICYKAFNYSSKKRPCSGCPAIKTLKDGMTHITVTDTPTDRGIVNFKIISSPVKDADGEIIAAVVMVDDVTEQKKIQEELSREKEYSELLLSISPSAIFTVDIDKRITSWNKKAEEITGYSAEEVLGKKCTVFSEHPCREHCVLYNKNIPKPISNKECVILTKSGGEKIILKNVGLVKNAKHEIVGGIEIFVDITKRKAAEEALQKEKMFTDNALDTLKDVFYAFDLKGKFLRWNNALSEVSGYSDKEISSMNPLDFFKGFGKKVIARSINDVWKKGHMIVKADLVAKKGQAMPYEFTGFALKDKDGKTWGLCGVGRDISARIRMEKAIRESESRYRALFENTGTATLVADSEQKILVVNSKLVEIFGYSRNELENKKCICDIADENDRDKIKLYHKLRMIDPATVPKSYEAKGRKKNGEPVDLYLNAAFVPEMGHLIVSIQDITELKSKEGELLRKREILDKTNLALEHKFKELKEAMTHIKRLEGLMPICSKCKKMLTEDGKAKDRNAWIPIEQYISERTDASFTHGLCPDCFREIYNDEIMKKKPGDEEKV